MKKKAIRKEFEQIPMIKQFLGGSFIEWNKDKKRYRMMEGSTFKCKRDCSWVNGAYDLYCAVYHQIERTSGIELSGTVEPEQPDLNLFEPEVIDRMIWNPVDQEIPSCIQWQEAPQNTVAFRCDSDGVAFWVIDRGPYSTHDSIPAPSFGHKNLYVFNPHRPRPKHRFSSPVVNWKVAPEYAVAWKYSIGKDPVWFIDCPDFGKYTDPAPSFGFFNNHYEQRPDEA